MSDDFAFPEVPVELRPLFLAVADVVMRELREPGHRACRAEISIQNRIRHAFEAVATTTPGRGWFARQCDDEGDFPGYWQPTLQLDGLQIPSDIGFESESDCLDFIRTDIIGKGLWTQR